MTSKMTGYKIFRLILGKIYKFWYNPKIIGKENIPTSGKIILAGNHIHIMDQCNIIIVTKRCIHYMAKKEYFEGKFAWFFKITGCISVDRSKKDNEATSSAIEVLNNNHALGIFPEGTRNSLKEERIKELYDNYFDKKINYQTFFKKIKKNKTSQINYLEELMQKNIITKTEFIHNIYKADNYLKKMLSKKIISEEEYYNSILLPLKYGTVSMALKTDSYIVPYAITGDYKFRSKNLTIRIGKPFKAEQDLEKTNNRLRQIIKDLLKENLKNSGK